MANSRKSSRKAQTSGPGRIEKRRKELPGKEEGQGVSNKATTGFDVERTDNVQAEHNETVVCDVVPTSAVAPDIEDLANLDQDILLQVMSQQTQISRVVEYWKRWIDKWPTVEHLAQATQEDVNQMWSGLGYYRRARYLLEGAQYVMEKLGGNMPTTCAELQKIPGIGSYTAAAISSIACCQPVAVIDANVIRVVSRLFVVAGDYRKAHVAKQISQLANEILDKERPGCFNQAMMELGALVCTGGASTPQCGTCPINKQCAGYKAYQEYIRNGGLPQAEDAPRVTNYPTKIEKAEKREEHLALCVVEAAGKLPSSVIPSRKRSSAAKENKMLNEERAAADNSMYLLVKRPDSGLLAGLWQFPGCIVDVDCTPEERKQAVEDYLEAAVKLPLSSSSISITSRQDLGEVVHVFSHIRMTIHVQLMTVKGLHNFAAISATETAEDQPVSQWMTAEELNKFGLPSGFAKVWKLVKDHKSKQKSSITKYFQPSGKRK